MSTDTAVDKVEQSSNGVGTKAWASRIRQKAKQLAKESEHIFMELGKLLYIIWDTPNDGTKNEDPLYMRWGFDTFADYVESELGMDRRRAQRLRKVWYALEVDCKGISEKLKADLVDLGSTKLRELSRVLSTESAQHWYDTCVDLNVNQIIEVVNDHLDQIAKREGRFKDAEGDDAAKETTEEAPEDGTLYNENFKLYPQQQRNLKDAMAMARVLSNNKSAKKGHCLDLICMDFVATNDVASKDPDKSRETYIKRMEKNLGIKIIAIEPKSGEIVHGLDTLEAIARREPEE